jgi:tetratricopeptide (TPR) repeat protein
MLRSIVKSIFGRGSLPAGQSTSDASPPPAPTTKAPADAQSLYLAGRFREAREAAEHIEARDGITDVSLNLRANCLQYERRFEDAARLYEQLAGALERSLGERHRRLAEVLIDWGLALLRAGAPHRAIPVLERAAAAAPDYPPAVGCARFPALMGRSLTLPRRELPPRVQADMRQAALSSRVEIVYFFAGRESDPRFREYIDLLQASAGVARRTQPHARIVVLTDAETPFPESLRLDIERFDIDHEALMVARFEAIAGFLARKADRDEPVCALFCDPDTLVARDLAPLFDGSFDIAYTWRSRFVEARLDHEPFVAGAIYVQCEDAKRPLRFFRRVLAEFATVAAWPEVTSFYPHPIQVWRGDQIVPAAVIGWREFIASVLSGRTDRLEIDGVAVAFLPSDPYCFTFEAGTPDALTAAKFVLDFKGDRKAYLAEAAARLLAHPGPPAIDGAADEGRQRVRERIAAALAAGDESAALRDGAAYLASLGDSAARIACRRIVDVDPTAPAAGGIAVADHAADPAVAPRCDLLKGIAQHPSWAESFAPTAPTLLRITRGCAIAPNLILTAAGDLLDDCNGFPPSELVHHQATQGTFLAAVPGSIVLAERWRDQVEIDGPTLYLGASSNYAEWLLGDVPRLALYETAKTTSLLLHGDVQPFHLESLAALGIARERIRIETAATRVEFRGDVTFCTTTLRHHSPSATALRWLRRAFQVGHDSGSPRLIYLSRMGMPRSRRIRNELEIERFLTGRGFAIVRPETLGVAEQARLAAGGDVIVGPYGANLANLVFAARAQRVVIIATKSQPEFARLLGIFQIPFRHVVPQGVQVRHARTYSESVEFDLDLGLLERALEV